MAGGQCPPPGHHQTHLPSAHTRRYNLTRHPPRPPHSIICMDRLGMSTHFLTVQPSLQRTSQKTDCKIHHFSQPNSPWEERLVGRSRATGGSRLLPSLPPGTTTTVLGKYIIILLLESTVYLFLLEKKNIFIRQRFIYVKTNAIQFIHRLVSKKLEEMTSLET